MNSTLDLLFMTFVMMFIIGVSYLAELRKENENVFRVISEINIVFCFICISMQVKSIIAMIPSVNCFEDVSLSLFKLAILCGVISTIVFTLERDTIKDN